MAIAILICTLVYAAIGAVLSFYPAMIMKDKALFRTLIWTAVVCMWLFWLVTYMSQLNPIIVPTIMGNAA